VDQPTRSTRALRPKSIAGKTRRRKPVGSKNSAELEVVLSTTVAAVWVSTFQLLEFT